MSALVFGGADIAQQMEALARGLVPNKVDLAFMEACGSPTVFPGKSIQ
ncbi:hypothetical protein swp_2435 [Shewanella piezotolerans WP3]|uniref:Uncharacterized protein n=1 Tax=Shewanella piezotolerans (strain WP3 / JCM 13877) TaxID=225849 RepID=B8CMC1_SHEPW|nr:hypothetical protein swp_2435 [Shewanella piezotolerans WP3]